MVDYSDLQPGFELPEHRQGPITRGMLALFAGASNDHVLLHIDSDFAKSAGMEDVFAHGMLSMAYLAQVITHWIPQERLLNWQVRFTAITPLYATVKCTGEVIEILQEAGERRARLRIRCTTDRGVATLEGEALVNINE